ncbi:MAG: hypothetical protein WAU86_16095 [Oricola sp.]
MSRSALLDLLPDFSRGGRRSAPPRAHGFEPLVEDAQSRERFSTLGMSSGFTGFPPEPDFGGPDIFGGEPELLSDIDLGVETTALDLAGMGIDDGDFAGGGLSTEASVDLMEKPAADVDFAGVDGFGPQVEYEEEATGITAHELLEAAHRAEINDIEVAHRGQMEEFVSATIPKLRADIVDTIADQLAPLLSGYLREAHLAKTLDALSARIAKLLEDSEAVGFELHGPKDLLSAFSERWPEGSVPPKLVPADGVDLVARIDKSVVATRLAEVDRLIQEALS